MQLPFNAKPPVSVSIEGVAVLAESNGAVSLVMANGAATRLRVMAAGDKRVLVLDGPGGRVELMRGSAAEIVAAHRDTVMDLRRRLAARDRRPRWPKVAAAAAVVVALLSGGTYVLSPQTLSMAALQRANTSSAGPDINADIEARVRSATVPAVAPTSAPTEASAHSSVPAAALPADVAGAQDLLKTLEGLKATAARGEAVTQDMLDKLPPEIAAQLKATGVVEKTTAAASQHPHATALEEAVLGSLPRDQYGIPTVPTSDAEWVGHNGNIVLPLPGGGDIKTPEDMKSFGLDNG